MASILVQVSVGGRVVIPVDIRKKMGIKIGDQVLLDWLEDSKELRIATRKQRLTVSRELVKNYTKNEGSVVDELIKQCREAAIHE